MAIIGVSALNRYFSFESLSVRETHPCGPALTDDTC
jgi:hypothetical protein